MALTMVVPKRAELGPEESPKGAAQFTLYTPCGDCLLPSGSTGCRTDCTMCSLLPGHIKWRLPWGGGVQQPISASQTHVVQDELEALLNMGVIESHSDWSIPVVLVPKTNRTACVDYRSQHGV